MLLARLDQFDQTFEETAGRSAKTLGTLSIPYSEERFWRWYLPGRDIDEYSECGWTHFLPLVASLVPRIKFLDSQFGCKVSLIPKVHLFPSGWTIVLSLQVTGEHDQKTLAEIIRDVFRGGKVFQWEPGSEQMSLRPVLSRISSGVRTDVFADDPVTSSEGRVDLVTTVLDCGRKTWSKALATTRDKEHVATIVRPEGVPLDVTKACVEVTSANPSTNFWVVDEHGFLLWYQKLLFSRYRQDHIRLECYHNNTTRAIMMYWQERGLLELMLREKDQIDRRLKRLGEYAWNLLSASRPSYWNRALEASLADDALQPILKASEGNTATSDGPFRFVE